MSPFVSKGMAGLVYLFIFILRRNTYLSHAYSVERDQTPRSTASDLICTVWNVPFPGTLGTNG